MPIDIKKESYYTLFLVVPEDADPNLILKDLRMAAGLENDLENPLQYLTQ